MSPNFKFTRAACNIGYFVQAIVNNFLPVLFIVLQEQYSLNYEQLGRIILFNFVTQLITDAFTPKIVSVLGYRKTAVMCQGGAALGLSLLVILPHIIPDTYLAIMLSVVVYAFSSGLMEVVLSPMCEALPSDNKSANMALLHSFYCWGQLVTVLVTTLLVKLLGYSGWTFIPLIWAVIPFLNMFSFFKAPIVEPEKEKKGKSFKELVRTKAFVYCLIMMLCAGACEIALSEWSSLFAQRALGVSKTVGDIAGPCAFALFMGTGRVVYATVSNKVSFKKAVMIMSALCFLCYVGAAVSGSAIVSLAACALCGFTVSFFWPGTYSYGARLFPLGGTLMFSMFAMCGDLGCSLGPWVIGAVADVSSLNIGILAASVFAVIMFVTSLCLPSALEKNTDI
ncbi:MAG: MFS transporter [Clostridia bacterium]|nr:MFS transporter [Clostridia bacterium]